MSSIREMVRDAVRDMFVRFRFDMTVGAHHRKQPPTNVYHYTTSAGFYGIVTQRALRATNYSFLNDPTELTYGRSVVRNVLAQEGVQGTEFGEFVRAVAKAVDDQALSEVYVACFTELGDDLSQWRAYGVTSNTRYAIGFDTVPLTQLQVTSGYVGFAQVLYDQILQESVLKEMLLLAYKFAQDHSTMERSYFAEATAKEIGRILPLLKSPAYHAEREWRLVLINSADQVAAIEFDPSRGAIRPYIVLPFTAEQPLPIASLRVMAPNRPEPALKAAGLVLRKNGLQVVPVNSEVPFAE